MKMFHQTDPPFLSEWTAIAVGMTDIVAYIDCVEATCTQEQADCYQEAFDLMENAILSGHIWTWVKTYSNKTVIRVPGQKGCYVLRDGDVRRSDKLVYGRVVPFTEIVERENAIPLYYRLAFNTLQRRVKNAEENRVQRREDRILFSRYNLGRW